EEVSPFEIEEEPQAEFSSPFEDLETLETAEESEIFSTAETPFAIDEEQEEEFSLDLDAETLEEGEEANLEASFSPFETSLEADELQPSAFLSEFEESDKAEGEVIPELTASEMTPEIDFFAETEEAEPSALLSELETASTEESLWEETPATPSLELVEETEEESLWEENPIEESLLSEEESLWEETPATPLLELVEETEEESLWEELVEETEEESLWEENPIAESLLSEEESLWEETPATPSLELVEETEEESLWEETPATPSLELVEETEEESLWEEQSRSPFELESLDDTESSLWEETPATPSLELVEETEEEALWEEQSRSPFELESLDDTESSLWEETPATPSLELVEETEEEALWEEQSRSPFELESLDDTESSLWEETPIEEDILAEEESLWEETPAFNPASEVETELLPFETHPENLETLWEEPPLSENNHLPLANPAWEIPAEEEEVDIDSEFDAIAQEVNAELLESFNLELEPEPSAEIDETSFDEILLADTNTPSEELPDITAEEETEILQSFEPEQEGLDPLWEVTDSLSAKETPADPLETDVWEDNVFETTSELAGVSDEEEAEILKAFEPEELNSPWEEPQPTAGNLQDTIIFGEEQLGSTLDAEEDAAWDQLDPFAEEAELSSLTLDDEDEQLLQAFEPESEETAFSEMDEPLPYAGISTNSADEELLSVFDDAEDLAIFGEEEASRNQTEAVLADLNAPLPEMDAWDELSDTEASELENALETDAFADSSWEEDAFGVEAIPSETLMDEDELLAALETDEETLEEADTSGYDRSDPFASLLDEDLQEDEPSLGLSTGATDLSADEDPLADLFPDESLDEFDPFASLETGDLDSEEMDSDPFADLGLSASETQNNPPPPRNPNP
ncbi:MAG: hypothetical protein OT478_07005, partial [Cyanobacteria bacterium FC1]|nr:hypothetical protein [Cyanobacteria bacterium FC1]